MTRAIQPRQSSPSRRRRCSASAASPPPTEREVGGEHRRPRERPRALVHRVDVAEAAAAVDDVVPRRRARRGDRRGRCRAAGWRPATAHGERCGPPRAAPPAAPRAIAPRRRAAWRGRRAPRSSARAGRSRRSRRRRRPRRGLRRRRGRRDPCWKRSPSGAARRSASQALPSGQVRSRLRGLAAARSSPGARKPCRLAK